MTDKQTGGPAFPTVFYSEKGKCIDGFDGMTLRDYFAAKAMQVFLTNERSTMDDDAIAAYEMADAMLEAREAKDD